MYYDIPIYKAEKLLAQQIRGSLSLAYTTAAQIGEANKQGNLDRLVEKSKDAQYAIATNEGQLDLYYMKSILATVGWNKNDDIFDRVTTWSARQTPEDKPVNYEHDQRDIIGHITGNYAIDLDGNSLANDLAVDELPDAYHIVNTSVLYKSWKRAPELQERMDNIIAEIANGDWFVSMECLFKDFDYALQGAEGNEIVQRNEDTAFLTKHLRAYGGDGTYGGKKLGRVLRNMFFSGKGLVRKPANNDSIIFDSVAAFNKPLTVYPKEFNKLVYITETDNKLKGDNNMADKTASEIQLEKENARLEKTLEAAEAARKDAEKRAKDLDEQTVKAKFDGLTSELAIANQKIASLNTQVSTEQTARTEAENKLAAANTQLDKLNANLNETLLKFTKAARLATIKEKLGLDDAAAGEYLDSVAELSDEKFNKMVTAASKVVKAPEAKPEDTSKASENALAGAQGKPEGVIIKPETDSTEGAVAGIQTFLKDQLTFGKKKK